jgi:hypothetical protein
VGPAWVLQGDKWDPLVRLAAQYEAHPQKFHEMAQTSARLTLSRPRLTPASAFAPAPDGLPHDHACCMRRPVLVVGAAAPS